MTERDEITGHRVDAKDQKSIDTQKFCNRLIFFVVDYPNPVEARAALIDYINAWGAEQRRQGEASQSARVQCLEHESKALAIAKQALITITFYGPATAVDIATKALSMMLDAGAEPVDQGKACAVSAPVRAELTDDRIEEIWHGLPGIAIHNQAASVGMSTEAALRRAHARAVIAADRAQPVASTIQAAESPWTSFADAMPPNGPFFYMVEDGRTGYGYQVDDDKIEWRGWWMTAPPKPGAAQVKPASLTDAQMWEIAEDQAGTINFCRGEATYLNIVTPHELGDVVRAILKGGAK